MAPVIVTVGAVSPCILPTSKINLLSDIFTFCTDNESEIEKSDGSTPVTYRSSVKII